MGSYNDPVVCTLRKDTLNQCKNCYSALSYAWADQPWDHSIEVNGVAGFRVSQTVENALRRLRYEDRPCAIWIDAICINQIDTEERNGQLHFMGSIYQQAQMVCIWLGETDPSVSNDYSPCGKSTGLNIETFVRDV